MKISIVVPFYNAEKYLERCLDSILVSLGDIEGEILAVDNNSTDESVAILKRYIKKNSQITALSCKTVGAAAARNYGAKHATGEYIWFIDADDEISKDAISKLIKEADETEADIVMMGAERIYPDGRTNYMSAVDPNDDDYKSRFIRYGMGPWQVMLRRKWWNDYFEFREGIIHEDMELMSALILHTDNYAAVDEPLYLYYQNDNSVLHQKKWNKHCFDIFPALEGLYRHFELANAEEKYHDELEWFFIWNLLIDSARDFAAFPEGKPGFKRTQEMLKEYFPKWRKNPFLKEKSLKKRLRIKLAYHGVVK